MARGRQKGVAVQPAAKLSKWDKKDIIEEAVKMRIKGVPYYRIKEHLMNFHGVSDRSAEYYMKDVVTYIKEVYAEAITPEQLRLEISETIGRLNQLYEEAEKPSDKLAIMKEISELKGLKKGKVDVSTNYTPIQIVIQKDIDVKPQMINIQGPKN